MIEDHLTRLAVGEPSSANEGPVLLEERFTSLDTTKWVLLGEPRIADGHLETKAPGGWERYCGLATREGFALDDHRPLLVEFELTPRVMGIDSQIVASAGDDGRLSYRFSFYGPRDRFGVYTQTHADPGSLWAGTGAGWRLRDTSMEVKAGSAYHVRLAITRRTFRSVVRELGDAAWRLPLWDSGPVPMDDLGETRLVFADVEPEGGTASSRWGPITIRQARAAR